MEIKLNSWDIYEAFQDYLEKKYSLEIDMYDLDDYPYLEYYKVKYEYEKHKNGKIKKDKNGLPITKDQKYIRKHAPMPDDCSISFYIDNSGSSQWLEP